MSSIEAVVRFLKENNLHQTLQTLQDELKDREDLQSFDIEIDELEDVEKPDGLSYYPYIMVPVKEDLSRKDIYDWGYARDPWTRYLKRCSNSKDLTTREGHKMLILTKCTDSNIHQAVNLSTGHNYVLAIEHAVGSFRSEFTPQEKAHSGNGPQENPINKREAGKEDFVKFIGNLIDAALSSNKAVTEEDFKNEYKCSKCGDTFATFEKRAVHARIVHQTVFPCHVCGIKDLGNYSKQKAHYKTEAHKQKSAEKNKAGRKPKKQKKEKREGEPKQPPNSYTLWSKENRSRIKDEYKVTGNSISSKCGEVWRSLNKQDKKPFEDKADELRAEWKRQMAEFDAQYEAANDQKKIKIPLKSKSRK